MNPKGLRGALSFFSQPTNASSLDEGDCMVLRLIQRPQWFLPKFNDPGIACFIIPNSFFLSWNYFGLANKNECTQTYQKQNQVWNALDFCDLTRNLLRGLWKYLNWVRHTSWILLSTEDFLLRHGEISVWTDCWKSLGSDTVARV